MPKKLPQDTRLDYNPYYNQKEMISIGDILLLLSKNVKTIIIIPVIFCSITSFYVLFISEPTFTSSAKIMSSLGGSKRSNILGIASSFGIQLPQSQTEQQWVYKEIIKSRLLGRKILKRKFNTSRYGAEKSLLHILSNDGKEELIDPDKLEMLALEDLHSQIKIDEDKMTGIYTVSINSFEPNFTRDLLQTIIEELDKHQADYNKNISSRTRGFIENRISETKKELEFAEDKLTSFTERNRRIENSPLLQLEQDRLLREVNVLMGVFTSLKQQLETVKIEEVKEADYVIVIDPPEIPIRRTSPKRKRSVMIAAFMGMIVGLVIPFLKEFLQNIDNQEKKKFIEVKNQIFGFYKMKKPLF